MSYCCTWSSILFRLFNKHHKSSRFNSFMQIWNKKKCVEFTLSWINALSLWDEWQAYSWFSAFLLGLKVEEIELILSLLFFIYNLGEICLIYLQIGWYSLGILLGLGHFIYIVYYLILIKHLNHNAYILSPKERFHLLSSLLLPI